MKRAWTFGLIPFVFLFTACGEDPPWGEGRDGVPDIIVEDGDLDTFWVANLGVSEINQITGPDPGHETLVQAHFSDFSYYRVELADRLVFSPACTIITSRPVLVRHCHLADACTQDLDCPQGYVCLEERCLPTFKICAQDDECPGTQICLGMCSAPECQDQSACEEGYECLDSKPLTLVADRVTFGGLTDGDLVMTPDGDKGQFKSKILGGRVFGPSRVSVSVESAGGDRDFPAFTKELNTPAFPELKRLGEVKNPDLAAGPSVGISTDRVDSFIVEWKPSGADFFEFKLLPGAGSQTDFMKLRCITFDDGGLEIPAEAIHHMALDEATNFQVKVEHHFFGMHVEKEGDETKAAAQIDISSIQEGTVLR